MVNKKIPCQDPFPPLFSAWGNCHVQEWISLSKMEQLFWCHGSKKGVWSCFVVVVCAVGEGCLLLFILGSLISLFGWSSYLLIMLHNDITLCMLLCDWHSCKHKYGMTVSLFFPALQQKCAQYHRRCSSNVVVTLLCRRSKLARSPGSGGQTVLQLRGRDRVFSPLLLSDSSSSHIQFFP